MFAFANRAIAAAIVAALLLYGGIHANMAGKFAHAMHGSMESAADCMMSSCPADGPSNAADCAAHCIATAVTEQGPLPPLAPAFALFLAVFAAVATVRAAAPAFHDAGGRSIGKYLLHQRLSTIVLRN